MFSSKPATAEHLVSKFKDDKKPIIKRLQSLKHFCGGGELLSTKPFLLLSSPHSLFMHFLH